MEHGTAENEIARIAEVCDEINFHYSILEGPQILVPGYGRIYYDDQPGVEPGLVAEYEDGDADPIEANEVIQELRRI